MTVAVAGGTLATAIRTAHQKTGLFGLVQDLPREFVQRKRSKPSRQSRLQQATWVLSNARKLGTCALIERPILVPVGGCQDKTAEELRAFLPVMWSTAPPHLPSYFQAAITGDDKAHPDRIERESSHEDDHFRHGGPVGPCGCGGASQRFGRQDVL